MNVWDLEGDENTQFYAEVTGSPDSDYPDKIVVGIKYYKVIIPMCSCLIWNKNLINKPIQKVCWRYIYKLVFFLQRLKSNGWYKTICLLINLTVRRIRLCIWVIRYPLIQSRLSKPIDTISVKQTYSNLYIYISYP